MDYNKSNEPVWPAWRSLLFIPASSPRFFEKAATLPADAVILDLEESVAQEDKLQVRSRLPEMLTQLAARSVDTLVRVDPASPIGLLHDLQASVHATVRAVVIPKAEKAERIRLTDELLTEMEFDSGLPIGGIKLIPTVESAAGLLNAPDLAQSSERVMALAVGPEDLAFDLGGEPSPELLVEPCRRVAWAAKAANRAVIGFPGAIANYTDIPRLQSDLRCARTLGFSAGLCIHPKQLEACRAAFAVTDDEADWARRVDAAFTKAEQSGDCLCSVDGQMVDRPVALRARALLNQWQQQCSQRDEITANGK